MVWRLRLKTMIRALALAGSLVTLFTGLPADASADALKAVRAAECMVDVLKTVPGYVDAYVETPLGYGEEMSTVVYSLRAPDGQVFHRVVEINENSKGSFSVNASEGVTRPLFEAWHRCGVMTIDVAAP